MKNEKQIEDMVQNWRVRRLFRAVLVQAARDAYVMTPRSIRHVKMRRDALHFFEGGIDLKIICILADADFEEILRVVRENKTTKKEKYDKIILGIFKNVSFYY
jgi:hypothetical protein